MNTNEMDELLEMKEQLQQLKQQIERATTLREDNLRKTLKKGANSFRNREVSAIVLISFVALLIPPTLYFSMGMSLVISIFTFAFLLFALCFEIYYFRKFNLSNLMDGNLVETAGNLREYKRINRIWLFRIGLPFIAVWGVWYAWELISLTTIPDGSSSYQLGYIIGMVASLAVGGVIGGLFGYFTFYRPQMKLADEMEAQIKELTAN